MNPLKMQEMLEQARHMQDQILRSRSRTYRRGRKRGVQVHIANGSVGVVGNEQVARTVEGYVSGVCQ